MERASPLPRHKKTTDDHLRKTDREGDEGAPPIPGENSEWGQMGKAVVASYMAFRKGGMK